MTKLGRKALKVSLAGVCKDIKVNYWDKICAAWYDFLRWTWPFNRIRDAYYHVRNLLFCRYDLIRTGLNPTRWWDKDALILYGLMNLLEDFVEKEKCFETICWDEDEYHKHASAEIQAIYAWWKDYPSRQKQIEQANRDWHESRLNDANITSIHAVDNFIKCLNIKASDYSIQLLDKVFELEEALENEEQEMLTRLIKIRKFLWT